MVESVTRWTVYRLREVKSDITPFFKLAQPAKPATGKPDGVISNFLRQDTDDFQMKR
jgi:hypothetical protein